MDKMKKPLLGQLYELKSQGHLTSEAWNIFIEILNNKDNFMVAELFEHFDKLSTVKNDKWYLKLKKRYESRFQKLGTYLWNRIN